MSRRVANSQASSRCGGWTLLELIVALAVLAVIAVIAAPRSFDAEPFRVRAYAVEVAAAARLARSVALASGCAARLTIDNAGFVAQQAATSGTHCAGSGFARTVVRVDGSNVAGTAPAGLPAVGTLQWIFNADGTTSISGGTTATLGPFAVTLDAASGAVSGP